jgi:hypothetical protein
MKNFIFRAAFRLGSIRSVSESASMAPSAFSIWLADVGRLLRKSGRREHQGKAGRATTVASRAFRLRISWCLLIRPNSTMTNGYVENLVASKVGEMPMVK